MSYAAALWLSGLLNSSKYGFFEGSIPPLYGVLSVSVYFCSNIWEHLYILKWTNFLITHTQPGNTLHVAFSASFRTCMVDIRYASYFFQSILVKGNILAYLSFFKKSNPMTRVCPFKFITTINKNKRLNHFTHYSRYCYRSIIIFISNITLRVFKNRYRESTHERQGNKMTTALKNRLSKTSNLVEAYCRC